MKTVTKEEVERVFKENAESFVYEGAEKEILNELFPPEFKVGDWVFVTGKVSQESNDLDGKVVQLKLVKSYAVSSYGCGSHGMHLNEVRHATPEEIAAATWEANKPYKVWNGCKYMVRISADEVGMFYPNGEFEGGTIYYDKYEKL